MVPNGLFVLLLFSGLNDLYSQTFLLQCKKGVLFNGFVSHEAHIIKTDKPYQVTRAKERSDVFPDTIPPALTLHPSLYRRGMAVLAKTPLQPDVTKRQSLENYHKYYLTIQGNSNCFRMNFKMEKWVNRFPVLFG